jgi:tRNA A-37 threonylcarbamoyl transferase component Bud32
MDWLHLVYVLARWLCMEFLLDEPQKIMKHSSSLFSCELRADANIAKGRSVLLNLLGAILFMDQAGVSHNDLKIQHLYCRPDRTVVVIDVGLAQQEDLYYERCKRDEKSKTQRTGISCHDVNDTE